MKRYLMWYVLQLKKNIFSRSLGAGILAMVLLSLFVAKISFPSSDNALVGIVCGESEEADAILSKLEANAGFFTYLRADSEEELLQKVKSGTLECGFVFAKDFDERCKNGDFSEAITYYCSSTTTKGAAAKDCLYAAFLEAESRIVLRDAEEKLYGDNDENRMDRIMERFFMYVDSDEVFGVEVSEVSVSLKQEAVSDTSATYPVRGCIGILVFFITFLYGLDCYEGRNGYPKILTKAEAAGFWLCGHLAAGTVPAAVGVALAAVLGEPRSIGTEIFRMLLLLFSSSVWGVCAARICRNYVSFLAQSIGLVLVNVLICPVFFDIVDYVRAFEIIRLLTPLGSYI